MASEPLFRCSSMAGCTACHYTMTAPSKTLAVKAARADFSKGARDSSHGSFYTAGPRSLVCPPPLLDHEHMPLTTLHEITTRAFVLSAVAMIGCAAPPPQSAFEKALAAKKAKLAGGLADATTSDDASASGDVDDGDTQFDVATAKDAGGSCIVGEPCKADCKSHGGFYTKDVSLGSKSLNGPLVAALPGTKDHFAIAGGLANQSNGDVGVVRYSGGAIAQWGRSFDGAGTAGKEDVAFDVVATQDGKIIVGAVLGASSSAFSDGDIGVVVFTSDGNKAGAAVVDSWPGKTKPSWRHQPSVTAVITGRAAVAVESSNAGKAGCAIAGFDLAKIAFDDPVKSAKTTKATSFTRRIGANFKGDAYAAQCRPRSLFASTGTGAPRMALFATIEAEFMPVKSAGVLFWLDPDTGSIENRVALGTSKGERGVAAFAACNDIIALTTPGENPTAVIMRRVSAHGSMLWRGRVASPLSLPIGSMGVAAGNDVWHVSSRNGQNHRGLDLWLGAGLAVKSRWTRVPPTPTFDAAWTEGNVLLRTQSGGQSRLVRSDAFGNTDCPGVCQKDGQGASCVPACAGKAAKACDDGNSCTLNDCGAKGCTADGATLVGKACESADGCVFEPTCNGTANPVCKPAASGKLMRFETKLSDKVAALGGNHNSGHVAGVRDQGTNGMWLGGIFDDGGISRGRVELVDAVGGSKPVVASVIGLPKDATSSVMDVEMATGGGVVVCGDFGTAPGGSGGKTKGGAFVAHWFNDNGTPKSLWQTSMDDGTGAPWRCRAVVSTSAGHVWTALRADGAGAATVLRRLIPGPGGTATYESPLALPKSAKDFLPRDAAALSRGRVAVAGYGKSPSYPGKLAVLFKGTATAPPQQLWFTAANGPALSEHPIGHAVAPAGSGFVVLAGFKSPKGYADMSLVVVDAKLKLKYLRHYRTLDIPSFGLASTQGLSIQPVDLTLSGRGVVVLANAVNAKPGQEHDVSTWIVRTDANHFAALSTRPGHAAMYKGSSGRRLLGRAVAAHVDGSIGIAVAEAPAPAIGTKAPGTPVLLKLGPHASMPPSCAGCNADCSATNTCESYDCAPAATTTCKRRKKDQCNF